MFSRCKEIELGIQALGAAEPGKKVLYR